MRGWSVLVLVLLAVPGRAQGVLGLPDEPALYAGAGFAPGVGVHVTRAWPVLTVLTREVSLYADYTPRFTDEGGRLLVGAGVGGSVRVVRLAYITSGYRPGPYDLDMGLRFGPSFFFSLYEQTAASKARAYRLFADPFVRGSARFGSAVVFLELGPQAPSLRAGAALGL